MGNVQQQFASFVGNSPLKLMNEDTFLVVLKDLSVSDYVHLTMLCRTFNQLFGSNNFVWAQICETFASSRHGIEEDFYDDVIDEYDLDDNPWANSVAKILLAAFKGEKLIVNGSSLKPNTEINVRDKQLVNQFNFKEAIKKYHIHFIQRHFLEELCNRYVSGTTSHTQIEVRPYDGKIKDVWTRVDLQKHGCVQDYYYYVNFGCNAKKLEEMKKNSVPTPLYSEIGGRLVVYQKSKVEPQKRRFISRMPANLSRRMPQPQPRPLLERK